MSSAAELSAYRVLAGLTKSTRIEPELLWQLWSTGTDATRMLLVNRYGDRMLRACRYVHRNGTVTPGNASNRVDHGSLDGFGDPLTVPPRLHRNGHQTANGRGAAGR